MQSAHRRSLLCMVAIPDEADGRTEFEQQVAAEKWRPSVSHSDKLTSNNSGRGSTNNATTNELTLAATASMCHSTGRLCWSPAPPPSSTLSAAAAAATDPSAR